MSVSSAQRAPSPSLRLSLEGRRRTPTQVPRGAPRRARLGVTTSNRRLPTAKLPLMRPIGWVGNFPRCQPSSRCPSPRTRLVVVLLQHLPLRLGARGGGQCVARGLGKLGLAARRHRGWRALRPAGGAGSRATRSSSGGRLPLCPASALQQRPADEQAANGCADAQRLPRHHVLR